MIATSTSLDGPSGNRPGGVVRVFSDTNLSSSHSGSFIPYLAMADAQLSFHGNKDAVKFFISVPGKFVFFVFDVVFFVSSTGCWWWWWWWWVIGADCHYFLHFRKCSQLDGGDAFPARYIIQLLCKLHYNTNCVRPDLSARRQSVKRKLRENNYMVFNIYSSAMLAVIKLILCHFCFVKDVSIIRTGAEKLSPDLHTKI